ncbi:beta-lactamase domain-containing protein 2 isoform X2 [Lingula anatina]|uniref:Beta-lactamase domain-containing protein 2 isoform X2 n=1 Tax=Lingula anatina TaxID=7574 RepID=A0A1S3I8I6_LINAN|nr:beta-lactamase domain-containing protein 2 isoform X2 [Lingula anatina]|eukprot:XP_013394567.1 beta-lactamase domain-containing protein 2 isoform X2 [Lingula anatina]
MSAWKVAGIVLLTAIAVTYIPNYLNRLPVRDVQGWTAPGWKKVAKVYSDMLKSGQEKGGGFAVYHKGELVVDIWGGYRDTQGEGVPWKEDTLGLFFSTTKGVAALMVAMLVDRGHLDYDKTVATYWPEFAQNGKEKVTVAQLLSHQAGLSAVDFEVTEKLHNNTEEFGKLLAGQKPFWKPGTAHGYHALTFGMYVDQLMRRADPKKRGVQQFFKEELAKPLGLDFFIGLPPEEMYRMSRLYMMGLAEGFVHNILTANFESFNLYKHMLFDPLAQKAMSSAAFLNKQSLNQIEILRIPLASMMGIGTPKSIAKLYGVLANGGATKDFRMLSKGMIKKLQEPAQQTEDPKDRTLGFESEIKLGFFVANNPKGQPLIGHPGAGGQMGYADVNYNLGFAYLTNHGGTRLVDPRYIALAEATYECADAAIKTKK